MFASYMLPTWIAASFLALAAGAMGYFTVIRRSVFAAHALPLSAFPGGAAAVLTGINPLVGLLGFAFLGVLFVQQGARLGPRDLAIGYEKKNRKTKQKKETTDKKKNNLKK
jgi:zinc/manganese transport system permease protein